MPSRKPDVVEGLGWPFNTPAIGLEIRYQRSLNV
jgi:hypothetical protein